MTRHLNTWLLLLCWPALALAKEADLQQPIQIQANSVEIREQEGVSIYKGNVKITQGSLELTGDGITIHSTPEGISTIVVTGSPARYSQQNDQDQVIRAHSDIMDYSRKTGLLQLKGDALLQQAQNRFSSNHIIYNTHTDVVQAGGDQTRNQDEGEKPRVSITIKPDTPKDKPEETPQQ